jgi:hypothetical protein
LSFWQVSFHSRSKMTKTAIFFILILALAACSNSELENLRAKLIKAAKEYESVSSKLFDLKKELSARKTELATLRNDYEAVTGTPKDFASAEELGKWALANSTDMAWIAEQAGKFALRIQFQGLKDRRAVSACVVEKTEGSYWWVFNAAFVEGDSTFYYWLFDGKVRRFRP